MISAKVNVDIGKSGRREWALTWLVSVWEYGRLLRELGELVKASS